MGLPNCWEILKCGRERHGDKVDELGECEAAKESFGHSCWIVAGTFCGGVVSGTAAQKSMDCVSFEVFKRYNRSTGTESVQLSTVHPEEDEKYYHQLRTLSGIIQS